MNILTQAEIAAPIDEVFAALTDVGRFEAAATRRGAEVTRLCTRPEPGKGSTWQIRFDFAGKPYLLEARIADFARPQAITLHAHASGLDGVGAITLEEREPSRTGLAVSVNLRPRTLPARLLLQTIKLARARLTDRMEAAIGRIAQELEEGRLPDTGCSEGPA
ncbi:hypothetical protein RGUI_1256 [Rhodovulum sp. P5]|uniref:SRPBCC family protein n=1 Tax=Rhodovulum sp. P5 TaxID=1564506 RepID=UPI0009C3448C|nr:SRPBCC family protein [Rhodovulum sp. P5]ARE39397.1 hypothetical protein RGUI_1256 [Rhodovulum sp. P5]